MSEQKDIKTPQRQGMGGKGMHGMGGAAEKPKDLKQSLVKLIRFCKSYLPAMIIALVAAAIGTVFQIIGPDKIKDLINEVTKGIT
ncbi:MAG TPA: ABC transporter ATP-binding protein, partial [Bacillota bacterium]|nr:ABC transporter ATP-binding protein [Bacillota bacterium]